MDKENVHNGILFNLKKEVNSTVLSNKDESFNIMLSDLKMLRMLISHSKILKIDTCL